MSLRSRGSATVRARPKKRGGKKQCELGADCPYKDQYQHGLEFSHEQNSSRSSAEQQNSSRSSANQPHFRAFSGAGRTIPTTSTGAQSAAAAAVHRAAAARPPMREQNELIVLSDCDSDQENSSVPLNHNGKGVESPKKRAANTSSVIDLCSDGDDDEIAPKKPVASKPDSKRQRRTNQGVPSPSWGLAVSEADEQRQLAQAMSASNRDVVSEQDQEYYESLRQDQAKERAKQDEEEQIREEADLYRAIEESTRLAKVNEKRNLILQRLDYEEQLDPEPLENENTATIAFRLPSQCTTSRLVRRFHKTACGDQLYAFLKSSEELASSVDKWTLREVVGGAEIPLTKSLCDLGLVPRGMVVVQNEGL